MAEVYPDDTGIVIVAGQNGHGKSSLLDSVMAVLGGKDYCPDMPIRKGSTKAEIVCELNDLIITRSFSLASGTTLKVTTKDGTPVTSPQGVLDKLIGELSFDPLEFSRLAEKEPRKAVDMLRKLVGLDFTKMDADRKAAYDARTVSNRQLEAERGKLGSYPHDPTAPKEEISVAELTKQLEDANKTNRENDTTRKTGISIGNAGLDDVARRIENKRRDKEGIDKEIARLESELLALQNKLSAQREQSVDCLKCIDKLETEQIEAKQVFKDLEAKMNAIADIGTAPIVEKITNAEALNQKFRSAKRRKELEVEVAKYQKESDDYTTKIEAIDADKTKKLADAKFPVPGISFDESGVLLAGVPWNQGSTAEQIRASMAMGLAMNPTLRVVMVKDGGLLDKKSLQLIADMAAANNSQVWLEVIDAGERPHVLIVDGAVAEDTIPEPVAAVTGELKM